MRVLTLALALLLTGCSLTNLADILKAAGDDPATVSIQVNTIYGTVRYCRTAIIQGNVACDSNGITVKSEAATVGIPLNVVPQLSIGAPTLIQPAPVMVAPPGPRSEVPLNAPLAQQPQEHRPSKAEVSRLANGWGAPGVGRDFAGKSEKDLTFQPPAAAAPPRSDREGAVSSEPSRAPASGRAGGQGEAGEPYRAARFKDWLAQPPDTVRGLLRDVGR